MATNATGFDLNVRGAANLVQSGTNKIAEGEGASPEGISGDKIDILDLPMTDAELLRLKRDFEKKYAPYEAKIKPIFEKNLSSYLGKETALSVGDENKITAANLQFEAEETFLAASLAQNPDPVVYCDNSEMGNKIAEAVQTMLRFHAQILLLRRKLEQMTRQWSIYHLGVLKMCWNDEINDVAIENRKVQDFIFDPDGYVDVYGDFCSWLGERIYVTAERLIELFPNKEDEILGVLLEGDKEGKKDSKLGTTVCYTEWWTDKYCFSTFKDIILDKHKNEYFNYAEEGDDQPHLNHFAIPKKPYVFLSIFSLQEQPHDITGLIQQNIPNQKKISRRVEQLDANISQSNNGIAFSENNFTQETARQASDALTKGVGKVLVPEGGPISEAVVRIPAPALPATFFDELEASENHLRSSWGVQGIVSQPQKADTTARGMILNQNRDTTRIGGGITDVIEQSVAVGVYNWLVQLYKVFYDEKHFAAIMGHGKAIQYIQLSKADLNQQIVIGVTPNSMKPRDELTVMNQAQELYKMGAIGPKTLLETLDFPDPDEAAGDGVLWKLAPAQYLQLNFPELYAQVQQVMQQQQMAEQQQAQAGVQNEVVGGAQERAQGAQAHAQKMRQSEEQHQAKQKAFTEMASAKLAKVKLPPAAPTK